MWEIQLIVLLDFVILKNIALDFKRSRMQSIQDSWYWLGSRYVPDKYQWFMLTALYFASSVFTHVPQNIAQSLVQLREWCSGDCLAWYNFPIDVQNCGLLLLPGKQTRLRDGTVKKIIGIVTGKYLLQITKSLPRNGMVYRLKMLQKYRMWNCLL